MNRGFTLVELLITILLLGILFAVVTGAVTSLDADPGSTVPARLAAARVQATRSGEPEVLRFDNATSVTVFPDGSATPVTLSDDGARWEVDPWTAEARRVP